MSYSFLTPIDMAGNQIENLRAENLATAPGAGSGGRIYWNTASLVAQVDNGTSWRSLAFLDSPTFTGTPAAPTAAPGTSTTQLATTAFVAAAVTGGSVADGDKGDITVSGSGSVWTVDAASITLAKMANLAANSIIGNNTGSAATPLALTATQARTLLNVADGATANSSDATLLARANHTGTQTASTISDFASAVAATAAVTANTAKVTNATHTGDVTGATALTIANNAVSNAKAADMATSTIKGRVTAGTGDPEDLTAAQVRTLINVADGANNYTHPNHSGDVTSTGDGATTIAANAVTDAKLRQSAAYAVVGRASGTTGNVADIAAGSDGVLRRAGTGNLTFSTLVTGNYGDNSVSNPKLATMAEATIKGRQAATGTGSAQDLTAAQVRTIINVADGATANSSDASLRDRSTHTGTQLASTISDFTTAVNTQVVAYWDSIAGADADVDTIREVLDLVIAGAAELAQYGAYAADFGDGTATSYTITHNLNSLDVTVEVYIKATGETALVGVTRTSVNAISIAISPAPASNAMRVVVRK